MDINTIIEASVAVVIFALVIIHGDLLLGLIALLLLRILSTLLTIQREVVDDDV